MQVDAFTTRALGGNPCAIVFDCAQLEDTSMLAIAREMNLSETAFAWQKTDGNFRARYFTPAEEIPLAGHPTIATTFALVESGRLSVDEYRKIPLELRDGPIDVDIFAKHGQVENIVMSQRRPQFLRIYSPEKVLPAFGLSPEDVLPGALIQTVSTGTPQIMIPLKNKQALKRAHLDFNKYVELRQNGDFFSPHLFCLEGMENGATFARHFGVPPDTMEDPFTGSATGGMAAYLWHYGLIDEPNFIADQGHWMDRPGQAQVEIIGSRDAIETVKVGGSAVCVIKGELIF